MKLIFVSGPLEGKRFKVDTDITIGRDSSNGITIPDSAVSLVHAQIGFRDMSALVKDLGSTNGTFVNGSRVVVSELRDGDCLAIGNSKARVEFVSGDESDSRDGSWHERPATEDGGGQEESVGMSGDIFGKVAYFLKRRISEGGMGAVYEAEQIGADGFIKKVAIKTILPKYVEKEHFVSSFIGEARLVANLVHQNIVQIHHFGRHGRGYYIAMEYIDGANLTDFMAMHRRAGREVPIEIATFIASRVCRGLEYAHRKLGEDGTPLHLVHRDVSPNNIMIAREGEVKLTDFGVAKAAQFMEGGEGDLVGSVEYMSPEQADCAPVDARSDLFSLGLVYYELLTGVRVFQCRNDDIDETIERVKEAVIPDPGQFRSDLPDAIRKLLTKCLQKDPKDRHQSAGELGYCLEYEIYSKGYGPTIVALAKYVREME